MKLFILTLAIWCHLINSANANSEPKTNVSDNRGHNGEKTTKHKGSGSRIVGGSRARVGEIPWHVAFRYEKATSRSSFFCGGSLIDKRWVVSAAHCFTKASPEGFSLMAVFAEVNVNNDDGNEVSIPVKYSFTHSRYDNTTKDYDIALLKLNEDVSFNDYVKKISLPTGNIDFSPGNQCKVTGFGKTREGAPRPSDYLMKATVPIISNDKCKQYGYRPTTRMLCAGYEAGRIDACQGDSGGPLACEKNGKYYLVGAVSYGSGCGRPRRPGVYTKVKEFLDWIDTVKRQYP